MKALKTVSCTTAILVATVLSASAQLSITLENTAFTQTFDSLAQAGATNAQTGGIFDAGWLFLESGTSANNDGLYSGGTGSSTTGDTYSFGVAGTNTVTERAFGLLQTGTLSSILGFRFTNNTGNTITALDVAFRGETWRRVIGADTLAFSYQAGSPGLSVGTGWTAAPSLSYTSVSGAAGAIDGNATGNFTNLFASLTGLSILNGTTFTFRWVDATGASSSGMAIDNFSLIANPVPEPSAALSLVGGLGMMLLLRPRQKVHSV